MHTTNYTTKIEKRKRGSHLGAEERGALQYLKRLGYSNRAIARELNCSPSTIGYELKRGTPNYSGRDVLGKAWWSCLQRKSSSLSSHKN